MYTMYSLAGSCSTGIVVLLEKLGVDYKLEHRDDVENYKQIVPTGQVPALKTPEGQIITEGAAIGLYLLEKHGQDLIPPTPEGRAEFNRWLMFNYATLHPAYSRIFALKGAMAGETNQQATMQKMADKVTDLWAILDTHLEGRDYIVGDAPTLIDYLLAIYISWEKNFSGIKISHGKNIEKHVAKVAELPEFKSAYAREGIEFKSAA